MHPRLCKLACLVAVLALSTLGFAQQIVSGTAADGSLYQFVVPGTWNHQLVIYAHGAVDPQAPVALPNDSAFTAFRDALVSQGFAVGYSSYASNGFAVQDGVADTHALSRTFAAQFGKPDRTFLTGVSLGGIIVLDLAERFPRQYDGVLPMCGLIGGSPLEVKYVADARVLFDYFFPGVIPGTVLHTPLLEYAPGAPDLNVGNAVYAALVAGLNPAVNPSLPTLQFADALKLEAASPTEIISGALQVLGFDVRYVNDLLARTHGYSPYDNRFTWYSGSANEFALNRGVERVAGSFQGLFYLFENYQPTGDADIPTLTLHTTRDPLVPYWHEQVYKALAIGHRDANRLVQQSVNRFGHCAFNAEEISNAFTALVGWVDYGIKPQGGDVTVNPPTTFPPL